jgi:hypothetical protein
MFSYWEPTYFGALAGKNIPFPKCLWYHKYDDVYANKQPQQWEFFPKILLSTSKGDYHWEWIGTKNRTPHEKLKPEHKNIRAKKKQKIKEKQKKRTY